MSLHYIKKSFNFNKIATENHEKKRDISKFSKNHYNDLSQ